MNQDQSDQIMVVVLKDMVTKSVPGVLAIRHKLEEGETLLGSEVKFFIHTFLPTRWINSAAAIGSTSMILSMHDILCLHCTPAIHRGQSCTGK